MPAPRHIIGLLLLACCCNTAAARRWDKPVEIHGKLETKGNRVVDKHGDAVRLRGMSLFWSQWEEGSKYYNKDVIQWLYEDWHISLIRIAMAVEHDGYLTQPDKEMARVKTVVDAAIQVGIYVIVDWHDHNAQNHKPQAKRFFAEVAETYGSVPNVIFEIYNEPLDVSWSDVIKPYHEEVIPLIRLHSDNLIVLGTRRWSQEVGEAAKDPVSGPNLAYTLHFYASTHRDWERDKAKTALANGAPVFATEWGTCSASGDGDLDLDSTRTWLEFLAENDISDANWAISDKDEKCAALKPGADTGGNWAFEGVTNALTGSGSFMRTSLREFHAGLKLTSTTTTEPNTTAAPPKSEFELDASDTSSSASTFAYLGSLCCAAHIVFWL